MKNKKSVTLPVSSPPSPIMPAPAFPTDNKSILERLENIDPFNYTRSRNFVDGTVTYLSPYISRGVISLLQVKKQVLKKYPAHQIQKFLQELAWREYWQRVWQSLGDKIFTDIKQPQNDVAHRKMVTAIENAATGIEAIDNNIDMLYASGYMHNHVRMHVSSIACNIAKAHWLQPSQWLYYHLLDGDLASNSLSWQWVAGSFSSRKYYCNQDNINRYTHSRQEQSFLDHPYETIVSMDIPEPLQEKTDFIPETNLPQKLRPILKDDLPVIIYNSYNLDPAWHRNELANRILLLEPAHFKKYPVCDKVIQFVIELAKNIEGIQIFVADFEELKLISGNRPILFKEHPAFLHYEGSTEKYDDIYPDVTGYFSSFSAYWKKCEKQMD